MRRHAVAAALFAAVLVGCGSSSDGRTAEPTLTPVADTAIPLQQADAQPATEGPVDCGPGVGNGVIGPCVIRYRSDGTGTIYDATGRVIGYGTP